MRLGTGEDAQARTQRRYAAYIGLDVHKDTIAVSAADGVLSCEPQYPGEIPNRPKSGCFLAGRLEEMFSGEFLFCCEAGPCGYALYRQLIETRHDCIVVAPSLIPRKPGERVKNDRRDSRKLAQVLRSGSPSLRRALSPVHPCVKLLLKEDYPSQWRALEFKW